VDVVQFDTDAEAASRRSQLVSLDSRPKTEIEDDAQPKSENVLSDAPQLALDLVVGLRVPRTST
jgi:hypothetical protein